MIYYPILLPCFLNFAFDISLAPPPSAMRRTCHPYATPSCTARWWIVTQRNKIKHAPKHIHPSRNIAYLVGNNSWPVFQAQKPTPPHRSTPLHPSGYVASKTKGMPGGSIFCCFFWFSYCWSSPSCSLKCCFLPRA